MKKIVYPFKPKSTSYLQPGQFWGFELLEAGFIDYPGWYGCGRVLQIVHGSRRDFLAGMMDWVGPHLPTSQDIAKHSIVSQIIAGIDSIEGNILGSRSLEEDYLEPLLWLGQVGGNHGNPNKRPDLMRGLEILREATAAEHKNLLKENLVLGWGGLGVYDRSKEWYAKKIAGFK